MIAIAVMAPSAFAQVADPATVDPQAAPVPADSSIASTTYFHDAMNNRTDNDGTEWAFRGDLQYDFSEDGSCARLASAAVTPNATRPSAPRMSRSAR